MASEAMDFTGQKVHVVGHFFEELAVELFGGVINQNDKQNHCPDIIHPQWKRWIEVKAAGNMDSFRIWTNQFNRFLRPDRWRRRLDEPYNKIRLGRGFYCLAWYRNGEWNSKTKRADRRLSASILFPEHAHAYLAQNILRVCLVDVGAINSAWRAGVLGSQKEWSWKRKDDEKERSKGIPIKINGSALSMLEKSPLDLVRSWKLEPNRYRIVSTTVSDMAFKGYRLPEFPVTVISSRRFNIDFAGRLPFPTEQ